jgi:hypothetical protein
VLVATIALSLPDRDTTVLIATVLGVYTPIVAGIMALALKENHNATNSRLTELLELTRISSREAGRLEERESSAAHTVNRAS